MWTTFWLLQKSLLAHFNFGINFDTNRLNQINLASFKLSNRPLAMRRSIYYSTVRNTAVLDVDHLPFKDGLP